MKKLIYATLCNIGKFIVPVLFTFSYVIYLPKYVKNENFCWIGLALRQNKVAL